MTAGSGRAGSGRRKNCVSCPGSRTPSVLPGSLVSSATAPGTIQRPSSSQASSRRRGPLVWCRPPESAVMVTYGGMSSSRSGCGTCPAGRRTSISTSSSRPSSVGGRSAPCRQNRAARPSRAAVTPSASPSSRKNPAEAPAATTRAQIKPTAKPARQPKPATATRKQPDAPSRLLMRYQPMHRCASHPAPAPPAAAVMMPTATLRNQSMGAPSNVGWPSVPASMIPSTDPRPKRIVWFRHRSRLRVAGRASRARPVWCRHLACRHLHSG